MRFCVAILRIKNKYKLNFAFSVNWISSISTYLTYLQGAHRALNDDIVAVVVSLIFYDFDAFDEWIDVVTVAVDYLQWAC
eukprot:UN07445